MNILAIEVCLTRCKNTCFHGRYLLRKCYSVFNLNQMFLKNMQHPCECAIVQVLLIIQNNIFVSALILLVV